MWRCGFCRRWVEGAANWVHPFGRVWGKCNKAVK